MGPDYPRGSTLCLDSVDSLRIRLLLFYARKKIPQPIFPFFSFFFLFLLIFLLPSLILSPAFWHWQLELRCTGPRSGNTGHWLRCLLHTSLPGGSTQRFWHLPTDPRLGFTALNAELQGATGHWRHRTGNLVDNPENQNLNLQRRAERGERANTSLAETRRERTHPASQFPASASTRICLSFSWWCWFVNEEKR